MTITVHALKRAIGEVGREAGNNEVGLALATIYNDPKALTMLANRLSDRDSLIIHYVGGDYSEKALRTKVHKPGHEVIQQPNGRYAVIYGSEIVEEGYLTEFWAEKARDRLDARALK